MLKAIKIAKTITGKPVPRANSGGNNKPPAESTTIGIKTPKNKTPLYGQKAKAKSRPRANDPK